MFAAPQVVVADLRCHGDSAALSHTLRGPHTLEAAANDVIKLLSALKLFPEMLIGHSFGGKVVLQMTKHWSATARRVPRPVQVCQGRGCARQGSGSLRCMGSCVSAPHVAMNCPAQLCMCSNIILCCCTTTGLAAGHAPRRS